MLRFVAIVSVFCARAMATQHYGNGVEYSKWAMASDVAYAHAPVSHAASHAYPPTNHAAVYGPKTVHIPPPHLAHVPGKVAYKETYVKELHPKDVGFPHISAKYHEHPVQGYTNHAKHRSVTFLLPLFTAKNAPIITLTNKFPKDW